MFSAAALISMILSYVGVLFLVALWTEKKLAGGFNPAANPWVYALSLAVYCTSWTFFGSVGLAATSGLKFLIIYIGPTLSILFWWILLRRLVRIKSAFHVANIADFISARYDKSKALALLGTLVSLIGVTPYIALQLKSIFSTFDLLTRQGSDSPWLASHLDVIVLGLMIFFTIMFGVRRLDPTERHEGMVMALALECLVKLLAFVAVGVFVTWFLFDGFGDIFGRLAVSSHRDLFLIQREPVSSYLNWFSLLLLSASAVIFLPRQFHIAVIENCDEQHIRTAMWLFPLYMLVINIFVFPIAAAGLLLGYPAGTADTFVLTLPLASGKNWLGALAFIGGFSAATGMIMISTMTLSNMVSSHILLPIISLSGRLSFLRRHLLESRWVIVALILGLGYAFERLVGESYMLVAMGIISFTAVLQFAPVILGGLFWRGANHAGALMGLGAGFAVWLYTSLLPALIRSGWLPESLLEQGPWGIDALKPQQLFGLTGMDPTSHAVFWSLFFNIGLFMLGSLVFRQSTREQTLAETFATITDPVQPQKKSTSRDGYIDLAEKTAEAQSLLGLYLPAQKSATILEQCLSVTGIAGKKTIDIQELTDFHNEIEKWLSGVVGPAVAHETIKKGTRFSERETRELSDVYGEILANLRVRPEDLWRKIDYYREREELLAGHAGEQEQKITELNHQIEERRKVEEEVKTLNLQLEDKVAERTTQLEATNKELEAFVYSVSHDLRAPLRGVDGFSRILMDEFADRMPEDAKPLLGQLRSNAGKMATLIDDLLNLSRQGRKAVKITRIQLGPLAREVMDELLVEHKGRKIELSIEELPPCDADPGLMRIVLYNLLGNALKFTRGKELARIEVGSLTEEGQTVYFIRDNGAGFDMRYAAKLFGVFQRLHSAQEFEGTGVGLATVQRIIHRHGGTIRGEGSPGKGAAFYFTLGSSAATGNTDGG